MTTTQYFDTIQSPKVLVSVWHARGNQGAVGAVEVFAKLALKRGAYASSFGIFGAEKAGAPIMAFNRISEKQIEAFYAPNRFDLVVILDPTIGGFLSGTHADTIFVVNTPKKPEEIARELKLGPARILTVDATGIAKKTMPPKAQYPNTAMLGALVHLFPELSLELLHETIREAPNMIEKGQKVTDMNLSAAELGFNGVLELDGRGTDIPKAEIIPPRILSWREYEPAAAIIHTGNACEKITGTWRTERPVRLAKNCTNCMLCFTFCPDFSILTNEDHTEVTGVDYDHCKGCGICKEVCDFNAIAMIAESRAKK